MSGSEGFVYGGEALSPVSRNPVAVPHQKKEKTELPRKSDSEGWPSTHSEHRDRVRQGPGEKEPYPKLAISKTTDFGSQTLSDPKRLRRKGQTGMVIFRFAEQVGLAEGLPV